MRVVKINEFTATKNGNSKYDMTPENMYSFTYILFIGLSDSILLEF